MADCATREEGEIAAAAGFDLLGTTLSGYTGEAVVPDGPDLALVEAMRDLGLPVIAEGRYHRPEQAAAAIRAGAFAVVVGSALTRIEHVTGWFVDAIAAERAA